MNILKFIHIVRQRVLVFLIVLAVVFPVAILKAEIVDSDKKETLVKIAFIFKILDYTKVGWSESEEIPLCFYGFSQEKFSFISDNISQTSYKNIKLVRKYQNQSFAACKIVYFDKSYSDKYQAIITSAPEKAILTVSDAKYFADNGGIIEFYSYRGKIRFFINNEVALKQNIKFNAKLLELGGRRYD